MKFAILIATFFALLTPMAQAAPAQDKQIVARLDALLRAYAHKDVPAVMAMLDPSATMYGTAISEFETTPDSIRGLLQSDYKQWDHASFGSPTNLTMQRSGDVESVFFDAPFSATLANGQSLQVTVRFATVWKKHGSQWLLVQSMNADLSR